MNNPPSIATKKIVNSTPATTTTTTINVDQKSNKEESQGIDKNLVQETFTKESKNAKQVGPRIDIESNNKEENQENDKNFNTHEAVKIEETTISNDFQNSTQSVQNDIHSNGKDREIERNSEHDTQELVTRQESTETNKFQSPTQTVLRNDLKSNEKEEFERNVEYEISRKVVKSYETTKTNKEQLERNKEILRNIVEEPLESTTKTDVHIDHRRGQLNDWQFIRTINSIQETTTEKIEVSTNDNSLKTSMSSREEELISPSTEKSFSDAAKLFEKAKDFVTGIFVASTTESSLLTEMTTKPNLIKLITNTTTVSSPTVVIENECQTTKVCSTNTCKKSASRMLALMDHAVEPCNDFYKFSCGGMKINHIENEAEEIFFGIEFDELPNDKQSYSSKFKTYYDSCVIFEANYPANPVTLKRIYLNRLVEGLEKDNSELNDLTDLIGNIILSHPYGSSSRLMPLFDVVMDIGPDGKYVPVVTLPLSVSDIFEADTGDIYEQICLKDSEKFAKTEVSS